MTTDPRTGNQTDREPDDEIEETDAQRESEGDGSRGKTSRQEEETVTNGLRERLLLMYRKQGRYVNGYAALYKT